jgi:anti-anti-sigma regulatory factor
MVFLWRVCGIMHGLWSFNGHISGPENVTRIPVLFSGLPFGNAGKGVTNSMATAQVWKSSKFTIERRQGKTPGTVVFRLAGPFTARDMYGSLSPDALRSTFEAEEEESGSHDLLVPPQHILDLTEVPYIDSAGLGMIVSHYVRCQSRGIRLVLAGVCPRVAQLFLMTRVDKFFPRVATVEEADR